MKPNPLPMLNGIKPSYLNLPHDKQYIGKPLLCYLRARFPFIAESVWRARLNSGMVVNQRGEPLHENVLYQAGETIFYYREVSREDEPRIPFDEKILWLDNDLIVVDKPHFLPVTPSGRFLRETLLTRLRLHPDLQHLDVANISPLHRLDKDTAGVMLFSHNLATRAAYHALFPSHAIQKTYHALAATRLDLAYPLTVRTRLVPSEPFFLMRETAGEANAETRVRLLEQRGDVSLYELQPITGKKHQLRVQMMGLGMPLLNDALYPVVQPENAVDYAKPLQLLAKRLVFIDPITRQRRCFESEQDL